MALDYQERKKLVYEELQKAEENGYDLTTWDEEEIVNDLLDCSSYVAKEFGADTDDPEFSELIKIVVEWKSEKTQ